MSPVVFGFPGHAELATAIAAAIAGEVGTLVLHRFPDGETYVRFDTPLGNREVLLVCGLHDPDLKILPLLFAAAAANNLGALRVGVVAPYLAYLRQDKQFQSGEAVTSETFGSLVSFFADWVVTVDPHLHRYAALSAVYPIPAVAVRTAPLITRWIMDNVAAPVLVGPDSESEQWVAEVAGGAGAPYVILEKTRRGDREVEVSAPQIERWLDRTPVLVDDIISTARTMVAAVSHLREAGLQPPVCIGVHGIFAGDAFRALQEAGAARVVTCNTIPHESNGIDVNGAIVTVVGALVAKESRDRPTEARQ